jgi:protein-S-isoprenylcysteine O-methyltransferase Ste14
MKPLAIGNTAPLARRASNFGASLVFTSGAFLIYRFAPYMADFRSFRPDWTSVSGRDVLTYGYVGYSLLLLVFYFSEKAPRESKSIAALRALGAIVRRPGAVLREGLPSQDKLGLLTIVLKGFYAPLMVLSLFHLTGNLVANATYVFGHLGSLTEGFLEFFNSHGFWFVWQLILFFDVAFFTVGYLVEHPRLGNEIRSVDPTWLGWAVALACYPPFNGLASQITGWGPAEFPQFEHPVVHVGVNVLLLALMAVYSWASVALNLKASNLTHRGIIDRGPYRYVRHPAYIAKNLAWWLGTIPALAAAWAISAWDTLMVAASAGAWTAVYALRALTEEDHLRKVDGEYDAYCKKVSYRFIPGIY